MTPATPTVLPPLPVHTADAILRCRDRDEVLDYLGQLVDELAVGSEMLAAGEIDRSTWREASLAALLALQAAVGLRWLSPRESLDWLAIISLPTPPPGAHTLRLAA